MTQGKDFFLTVFIQEELVEAQAAGLFANEAVHVLGTVVMHSDGVFQWFDTRLQAERNLCVAHSVPGRHKHTHAFELSVIWWIECKRGSEAQCYF